MNCTKCGKPDFVAAGQKIRNGVLHCYYCRGKRKLETNAILGKARSKVLLRDSQLRYYYGSDFDLLAYEKKFENQNGLCNICGNRSNRVSGRLDTDHNHITGQVRDLLCNNCNRGIGHLKIDELGPELLLKAVEYTRRHMPPVYPVVAIDMSMSDC